MADETGKLTRADHAKVAHLTERPCPGCGEKRLGSHEYLLRGEVMGIAPHDRCYPLVAIGCDACGHTSFYSAILTGLIERRPKARGEAV